MYDPAPTHADPSPFHEGEQRIQAALGVREEMEPWGRQVIRGFLPDEHAAFYAQLPFLVAAARDLRGRPWATLLAGTPGFVATPDAATLAVGASPAPGDALADGLVPGADLGVLGIELHTRRRNRVNGRVRRHGEDELLVEVDQTFGNCPQHIRARPWQPAEPAPQPAAPSRAKALSAAQRRWIERADTFFIASGHRGAGESAAFGMDASHRGGPPGFVRVDEEQELVFPDYAGNNHFNTLGNLVLDPRAGLLFVDFARGSLLQLTGRVEIDWSEPDQDRFPGARRLVRFQVEEVVEQTRVLPLRWTEPDAATRELRVAAKIAESDDVTSFVFEAADGAALPGWKPGQHLPLEVGFGGGKPAQGRTYSLSNGPGSQSYRISVKREPQGRVSRHLHDAIEPGDVLRASEPAGDFHLDLTATPVERPIVLVGAGVGITPLASMLHAIAAERPEQPVVLVHGVRDGAHHPLGAELRGAVDALPNARLHVRYSRPLPQDVAGHDHDDAGRVDAALLERLVSLADAEFYLCGPAAFMGTLQADLERRGVTPDRIHFETF
ncbi:MAG: pyridoxamine 5'-phosphate oxidase family protein [Myxococcota bacterium]|nr:pyridoxamine 5'-phosphate oxidase family protein [Myxococcota bacterium]